MTKAQEQFVSRDKEDSRDFNVWYHNDDTQRLVWALYQKALKQDRAPLLKQKYLEPYVFFDGIDHCSFTDRSPFNEVMNATKERLLQSNKLYLPIIFKPELGGAHYMAGILRKEKDNRVTFFLFNPLGYPNEEARIKAKKRLELESTSAIGDMKLVMSPHTVQSSVKDGTKLVSCGPLSIAFVDFALNNPDWVESLDEDFRIPEFLLFYKNADLTDYVEGIKKIRQSHYELLSNVSDEDLSKQRIEDFYIEGNKFTLSALEKASKTSQSSNEDKDEDLEDVWMQHQREQDLEDLEDEENENDEEAENDEEGEEIVRHNEDKRPLINPEVRKESLIATTSSKSEVPFAKPLTSSKPVLNLSKKGINDVLKEVDRLERKTGFFSDSAHKKAQAIKAALLKAQCSALIVDVRKDAEVRKALGDHRIFSFFGLFKARSLTNVDQSLQDEETRLNELV
ncbi:TPA: hypothetical protein ACT9K7_003244 [Legionella pneumophila]|uniref:hypothetical protein n=1 Tax=Legionella pneumophila TaxID=446 RepID=UPI001A29A53B|nr:hypothetical protein [Legionella pneumophila]